MSEIRSVSVHLDADVAGYIAKMRLAGAETDKAFSSLSKGNLTTLNRQLTGTATRLDKVSTSASKLTVEGKKVENEFGRLGQRVDNTRVKVDTGAKSIDRYSGRMGLLADTALALTPALVAVGAEAVPAVAALGTNLLFAGAGAGTALLAFHGVGKALTALNKAALEPTDANLEAARKAMDALPPSAQRFTLQLQAMRPELQGLQKAAADGLLPGAAEGLHSLQADLPIVQRGIRGISGELGILARDAGRDLSSDRWQPFLRFVGHEAPLGLGVMGRSIGAVGHGVAELVMDFTPLTHDVDRGILRVAQDFDRWATSLGRTKGFQDFLVYVDQNGPRVLNLLGDTATAFLDISKAAAPLGGPVLDILDAVARSIDVIAKSDLGTPLFTGILAVRLFMRVQAQWAAASTTYVGRFVAGQRDAVLAIRQTVTAEQRAAMSAQELAAAQQRSSAGWATLRGGAVKAGVAAGAFGLVASGVTDKLHLTNTATLGLAGSMAGPWGAAIGAGVGLVLDFTHKQDNSAAATADFTSTLNQQTGAITNNTRALAAQVLQQDGAFDLANQLGVGLDTVTEAALSNKQAMADLNGQLAFYLQQTKPAFSAGGVSVVDPEQQRAARELSDELTKVGGNLSDDQEKTRQLSEAMGHNAGAAGQAAREHARLAGQLKAERQAAGQTAQQFLAFGDDLDNTKVSLDKWIHSLAAQAQALAQFGANAQRAANRGLRDGLIKELEAAGPAGALRMRQLANASQSEIKKANGAWLSGQRAIESYSNAVTSVPTAHINVDNSLALARIAQIRSQIDSIHSKTISINVTGGRITQQPGSADGATVLGPRYPYGDKVLMPVAPGEEIISNRRGQADRWRPVLKRINAGGMADGGTVPTHVTSSPSGLFARGVGVGAEAGRLTHELKGLHAELHNLTLQSKDLGKAIDAEKQKRDAIIQAEQQLASTVAENFRSQVFGVTPDTSNIWSSGPMNTDPARILRQNIRDARAYTRDIRRLRRRGLRGGALAEVDTLDEAQQALGLSRREDHQISRLFDIRQRASQTAGGVSAQFRFGHQLGAVRDEIQHTNHQLHEANQRLHKVEQAIKHTEGEAKKHAKDAGHEFGKALNGVSAKASRSARR